MASLFVNGPAHIFLGLPKVVPTGLNTAAIVRVPTYLGSTEGTPHVDIPPRFEGVHNDMAGSEDIDESYQGRSAIISCTFTRWNEAVYAAAVTTNPAGVRGFDSALDVGALMITENYAPPLYMVAPFALKAVFKNAGMPAGFRFVCAILDRETLPSGGTKPKKIHLIWHCRRILVPTSGPGVVPAPGVNLPSLNSNSQSFGILNYGFLLYDQIPLSQLTGFTIN